MVVDGDMVLIGRCPYQELMDFARIHFQLLMDSLAHHLSGFDYLAGVL